MEIVIRAAAAAVIGSILALLLRKYTPGIAHGDDPRRGDHRGGSGSGFAYFRSSARDRREGRHRRGVSLPGAQMHRDWDDHASGGAGLPGRTAGEHCLRCGALRNALRLIYIPARSSARSSPLWNSCFDAARTGARRLPREGACRFRCSDPGMDELTEALPEEAAPILSAFAGELLQEAYGERSCERHGKKFALPPRISAARERMMLLCVRACCSLTDTLDLGSRAPPYITFAAVAVIGTATISDLRSYLSLGTETLQTLSDYSHVLLPVHSSAAAASSGAAGSAAAKYAATAVCMEDNHFVPLLGVSRPVRVRVCRAVRCRRRCRK